MIYQTQLIRIAATFILYVLLTATFLPSSAQTTRRVTTAGTGDGSTWATASSLQAALTASTTPGDQVWIAAGTYKPHATDRTATFSVPAGVLVYGGFAGTEAALSDRTGGATILSGDLMSDDGIRPVRPPATADQTAYNVARAVYEATRDDNSNSVVTLAGANVTLDGLTITAGQGGNPANFNRGAGLYAGAGAARATLTACTFTDNIARNGGGGASFALEATLTGCTFTGNEAGTGNGGGGAIFGGIATLTNCVLVGNRAVRGGGLWLSSGGTVINSTLYNNTAGFQGGGIIARFDDADRDMAGIQTFPFILQNSILVGNTAPDAASGHQVRVDNFDATNVVTLQTNLIEGGADPMGTDQGVAYRTPGSGNITQTGTVDAAAAAVFASTDAMNENYLRLLATSPAVNVGNNEYLNNGTPADTDDDIETDAANEMRIQGGTVDLGAYESPFVPQTISFASPNSGLVGTDITLTATGGASGNPVTFEVTGEFEADGTTPAADGTVATLASGNVLTLVSVGMVEITATQAGNADYAPTTQTQTITVSQGTQTVAITSTNMGQATINTIELMATVVNASGVATGSDITYEIVREMPTTRGDDVADLPAGTNMLELTRPGTVEIRAIAAGDVNTYAEATATQEITVSADPVFDQTLIFTLAATSGTSGGEIRLTATSQDAGDTEITGLPDIVYAITPGSNNPTTAGENVATLATDVLTLASPGTISITASREAGRGGDGRSYGVATAVTQEITVSAAMQTLMFDLVADGISGAVIPLMATAQNAGGDDITAAVGLPDITYTSSDDLFAMVRAAGGGGQELLLKAPGTVTITALRGGGIVGGVTYAAAADVTQDIIVESATQTITFTPLANAGQVGEAINLTATVNSGMEVTLAITAEERPAGTAIADGTVATLDAGTGVLTFVGVGNVTVTASQTGGTTAGVTYTGATNVTQTFTVTQGTQTVAITSTNTGQATTTTIELTATVVNASGVATASAITYEIVRETPTTARDDVADLPTGSNMLELRRPGTVEIRATAAGDVNTYAEAMATQVITVTADPVFDQTLIFNLAAGGTSGDEITLTATSQDAGGTEITGLPPVMFAITSGSNNPTTAGKTVATLAAGVLTLASPGTVNITASREGGRGDDGVTYAAATDVTQDIMVSAAMQTLMFDLVADGISGAVIPLMATAQNAGGDDITAAVGLPDITYTSSDDLFAMVRAAGGGGQELLLKAPGTVTITALRGGGIVGGVTYAAAADVTQDIIVESATQTITFTPLANAGQVGEAINLTATVNSGMEVTLAITAEERPAGTAIADGTVATLDAGTGVLTFVGVGNVTVTASQTGGTTAGVTYTGATNVTQTFTVTQGTQTVAITSTNTGQATTTTIELTATVVNASGVATASAITYEIVRETPTTARDDVADLPTGSNMLELRRPGTVEIRATAAGDVNTYAEAMATQVITVTADPVFDQTLIFNLAAGGTSGDEITLTATSQDAGGTEITGLPPVMFAITSGSNNPTTAGKTVATLAAGVLTLASPGTVNITASREGGRGDDGVTYAAATDVTQDIMVSAATQTITFISDTTGTVGTNIELMATASSGLDVTFAVTPGGTGTASLGGDGITLTLTGVGTVEITARQAGNANYAAATQTQTITVSQGTQDITFSSDDAGDVGTEIELAATASSGLDVTFAVTPGGTGTASLDGNGTTLTLTGVGTVEITATQVGNANYAAATQTQTITVSQGTQDITFSSDDAGDVGTEIELAAMASSGLDVTFAVTPGGTGTASLGGDGITLTLTGVGTVEIIARQAGDANYAEAMETQTITVSQGTQTIEFTSPAVGTVGTNIDLMATASSGLDVTFAVTPGGTGTASLDGNGTTLTLTGVGTVEITATQAGNANYAAATQTQTITVEVAPLVAATIRRVTTTGAGTGDGSSWANAMMLQAALSASTTAGDQVWIAEGTYKPHADDRAATFSISTGVLVYGGFAGTEADDFDPANNLRTGSETILSGDLLDDDIERPAAGSDQTAYDASRDDNSYTVVTISGADLTLDGLVISGGERGTEEDKFGNTKYYGAGLYGGSGTGVLTLQNIIIKSNNAEHEGGGAYFKSTVSVTNATFTNNTATEDGGGAYFKWITTITGSTFSNNRTSDGPGGGAYFGSVNITNPNISSVATVTSSTFTNNSVSDDKGGGVYFDGSATVTSCTFSNNSATGTFTSGGGAYFDDDATVVNCVFANNSADGNGGGAYFSLVSFGNINSTVTNSTFYSNSGNQGGGIYANYGLTSGSNTTNINLRNNILMNNTANAGAAELYISTQNASQTASIDNNLIQGGNNEPRVLVITDDGVSISNIVDASDAAVVFVSTDSMNANYLRLKAGSPALNAGNNDYLNNGTPGDTDDDITTDAAGNARIQDGTVDLGAYEGVVESQTITFTLATTSGTVGASIPLAATTDATGLFVTFSIETTPATGVATLTDNGDGTGTLVLNGTGTVTVMASQAGNANYAAATPVERTITVDAALGIEEVIDDLVLYPNPTSGKLHFSEQVEGFHLYSSEGRLLDTWKNVRSADLTALPSGLYFVEVIRGGRSVGYRIVRK